MRLCEKLYKIYDINRGNRQKSSWRRDTASDFKRDDTSVVDLIPNTQRLEKKALQALSEAQLRTDLFIT